MGVTGPSVNVFRPFFAYYAAKSHLIDDAIMVKLGLSAGLNGVEQGFDATLLKHHSFFWERKTRAVW